MNLYFQQLELARNTTGEERVAGHDDVTSGNMAEYFIYISWYILTKYWQKKQICIIAFCNFVQEVLI